MFENNCALSTGAGYRCCSEPPQQALEWQHRCCALNLSAGAENRLVQYCTYNTSNAVLLNYHTQDSLIAKARFHTNHIY
jgi:hypothetical protein